MVKARQILNKLKDQSIRYSKVQWMGLSILANASWLCSHEENCKSWEAHQNVKQGELEAIEIMLSIQKIFHGESDMMMSNEFNWNTIEKKKGKFLKIFSFLFIRFELIFTVVAPFNSSLAGIKKKKKFISLSHRDLSDFYTCEYYLTKYWNQVVTNVINFLWTPASLFFNTSSIFL